MNHILKATLGLPLALSLSLPSLSIAESLSITQAAQVHFCLDANGVPREDDGEPLESCAEISAFSDRANRLYVTNAPDNKLSVLGIDSVDASLTELPAIDLSPYGGGPNSVAVYGDHVAVAVEADDKQAPGSVVVFDLDGTLQTVMTVGALPDMLTFSPNGKYLVVANEGEPNDDYTVDPEGSVSVIDTTTWNVASVDFKAFNHVKLKDVRVFGPGASVAQDLEPEYVTISADSRTAWVSLQENNALAIVDLDSASVTKVVGLGYKKHRQNKNAFDASNEDGAINIQARPTLGMYQPDAIAAFQRDNETFIISANEGDARDYDGYSEEVRVKDLELDPKKYPNAGELQQNANLGRLKTTTATGDSDGDGDIDQIYSYGARSFSIWNANGQQIFDSKSDLEHFLAKYAHDDVEADVWKESRSDDKGPEPESIALGQINGELYAFIGLERSNGIFIYRISNPGKPTPVAFMNIEETGDEGPEGLLFIPKSDTNGWLVVTNEISNTVSVYNISLK